MAKLSDEAYANTPYLWKKSFRKILKIKILDERKECESNIEKYPCQKKNWIKKRKKKTVDHCYGIIQPTEKHYNPTNSTTLLNN